MLLMAVSFEIWAWVWTAGLNGTGWGRKNEKIGKIVTKRYAPKNTYTSSVGVRDKTHGIQNNYCFIVFKKETKTKRNIHKTIKWIACSRCYQITTTEKTNATTKQSKRNFESSKVQTFARFGQNKMWNQRHTRSQRLKMWSCWLTLFIWHKPVNVRTHTHMHPQKEKTWWSIKQTDDRFDWKRSNKGNWRRRWTNSTEYRYTNTQTYKRQWKRLN